MGRIDNVYNDILSNCLSGYSHEDPKRKGVIRFASLFSHNLHYRLTDFPAITTKKLAFKSVTTELLWFLRGESNIKYLIDRGVNIWNKDTYNYYCSRTHKSSILSYEDWLAYIKKIPSDLSTSIANAGKIYPYQWRHPNKGDQLKKLIEGMIKTPFATDLIVNSWSVEDMDDMALPPCHYSFQVVCVEIGNEMYFSLIWDQRSVDVFLGLPFNIASYALLMHILAKITGYKPFYLCGNLKNLHVYDNAVKAAKEQIERKQHPNCTLQISDKAKALLKKVGSELDLRLLNDLEVDDFKLIGYESETPLKVEMIERDNDRITK